jgi:hypothetical protein
MKCLTAIMLALIGSATMTSAQGVDVVAGKARAEFDRIVKMLQVIEVEAQKLRDSTTQSANHGFSVILAVGDLQGSTPARNLPDAASKALADMKQFLPYKSYDLLDAQWILGSPRSIGHLRGPENREYDLELRTTTRSDNTVQIDFSLRDPAGPMTMARKVTEAAAARGRVYVAKYPGRLIETTFTMDVGETVVVGTSRLQGDKALIVLLTAVGR